MSLLGTGSKPIIAAACIALLLLLASIATLSTAKTSVDRDITTNTTWTPEGSPYIVNASIAIKPHVVLTIKPGTTTIVADGVTIRVKGVIIAVGTKNKPIAIKGTKWAIHIARGAVLVLKGVKADKLNTRRKL